MNWSFPREDISIKESISQIALAIRDEVLDLEKTLRIMLTKIDRDKLWVNPDCGLKTRAMPETVAYHVEPVVHLTCLHYDRTEIDKFAKILADEGIRNVLALRGDKNPDIPEKDDFKHALDLISYMKTDNDFCFLGACYPECHPESDGRVSEIRYLKAKVDAGAEVLLSQLFFDNSQFLRFVGDCRIAGINVPVIPGIMPVINASQIKKMVTMCGASFPERFQKIISKYENNKKALFDAGMSYAISQVIELLTNDIEGIHLYTMNNPLVAKKICEGIRNILVKWLIISKKP